ncbi:MAG: sigma-70 family RNA polymerase sigma factor [Deltaproteobacteria bacterium]|nr:sigma-70 family RNA polymerase sigma factor [Deltaproteobacteria bacterium]
MFDDDVYTVKDNPPVEDRVLLDDAFDDDSRNDYVQENLLYAYMSEMRNHSRITPERELILGKRIKKGLEMMISLILGCTNKNPAMKDLKTDINSWLEKTRRPRPSESELIATLREGVKQLAEKFPRNKRLEVLRRRITRIEQRVREAMDELVTANLRLVFIFTKMNANRGLDFADLIQEGNIGLIKAAGKYDYTMGFRFSTYAAWWIRQSISRAIYDKAKTIRFPIHFVEFLNAFHEAYYNLVRELQRAPTPFEISEFMGVSVDKLTTVVHLAQEPISLDAPWGDTGSSFGDLLVAEGLVSPLETLSDSELCETIREALTSLPDREEQIIRQRFGLDIDETLTLEEVGKELQISRERVRQLEKRALTRLRSSPQNSVNLANFL